MNSLLILLNETLNSSTNDLAFIRIIIAVLLFTFLFLFIIISYFYTSIAYYHIAKKLKERDAWMSFIPFFRYILISRMANMHYWPVLLIVPIIITIPFILINEILFIILLFISIICLIIFGVFWFIWHYKIYERRGKSGWWIILTIIPNAGAILYYVFLGIVAWSKDE